MFRDRPLTWLFVIATVCVDLVLAITDHPSGSASRVLGTGLILGQSLWLGCWLVVGSRHRLERGAVFVVGQLALTLFVCLGVAGGELDSFGRVIAIFSFFGALAFFGALCGWAVFRWYALRFEGESNRRLQFPIIELFGWTVVVAIASAVMRQANFSHLFGQNSEVEYLVGCAVTSGFFAAILVSAKSAWKLCGAATAIFALYYGVAYQAVRQPELITTLILATAYTALWVVVVRLDAPSRARTEPLTSSDDQTSPLQLHDPRA